MIRAALIFVALAGCSKWLGIDKITYEGPANDATGGGSDSGDAAASIDALGPTSTLTITVQGNGMVGSSTTSCTNGGPPCVTVFPTGTLVQLVPSPNPSLFSYWDGACLSQNDFTDADPTPACQLTMNGDRHVVASFTTDSVLNMIPSAANTTDLDAHLTNSASGQSSVTCPSGPICTLDFALGAPPPFQIAGINDPPCATFGTFTGQACQLGSDTCPITFPNGAHVLNVEYNFDLGVGGPTCAAFK